MITNTINSIYALMAANEEVGAKLAAVTSAEEAITILAENGINVTADDLKELITVVHGDELPVDLLDLVAGGGKAKDFFWGFCDGLSQGWKDTKEFFGGLFRK